MESSRHWLIYVLELEGNNYYVGITSKAVEERYKSHLVAKGKGSMWTALHKPLRVIKIIDVGTSRLCPTDDENLVTIEYIWRYGIEHVRGGHMCYKDLDRKQRTYEHMLYSYWLYGWLDDYPSHLITPSALRLRANFISSMSHRKPMQEVFIC